MKWIGIVVLCLLSTSSFSSARTALADSNSSEGKSGSPDESVPLVFPKVISESDFEAHDAGGRSGFNGKVPVTDTNTDENKPGVYAYGLPKKYIKANGLIERIPLIDESHEGERNGRLVQAYGMEKKHLESSGEIERLLPASLIRSNQPERSPTRHPRSAEIENPSPSDNSHNDDLEAQDSKVFRPLFVYRQQQAKKFRQQHYKCHNGVCSVPRSHH